MEYLLFTWVILELAKDKFFMVKINSEENKKNTLKGTHITSLGKIEASKLFFCDGSGHKIDRKNYNLNKYLFFTWVKIRNY